MSDRGSPSDHTATETTSSPSDAPAGTSSEAAAGSDGRDANSLADASSPSEGATKTDDPKPTLADVIRTAAEKPDPEGASPAPVKDGKDKPSDVEPSDTSDKNSRPDDSKLSFHNHPRWQEVTGLNRELRTQVETLTPDAEQFRKINSFMTEHHLSPDEVGDLFIVGAMAKAGDARVLQKIDEFRNKVALSIGEAIPDDIQAKVDSGEISEAAAKELAKAKAAATSTERQIADRDAADANRQQAEKVETLRRSQEAAVTAWDVETRKSDPDFAKKENAIARYAKALIQEYGPPRSTEDAVALIKAAYKQVNADFVAALPKKEPVHRAPVASSATGAKPVPKTLREAIEQAAAAG